MPQTPNFAGPMGRQMGSTASLAYKRRIKFRVQGCFDGDDPLKTISEIASKLHLSGFVKVGPRGLPEGEAQGDEDRLSSFIQRIKRQLPAGHVTDVESSEISAVYETLVAEYKNKFFGGGFRIV
ncbi:hypothetical protein EV356DRAFT_536218 [Viridothelium virens]|uniref:Acylphosphatase-like domain-containing protein n=1 Tax=Viridothelium virens TaxID=1048519 RepID=A0A6A6GY30_VIRVR|nr:hypothetical protein EV356DRAFT_536218 [Viridothelium virens]